MGIGDIMQEIGGEFMTMLAALGILFGFVFLFWIWGIGGTWMLIVLIILAAAGFLLYKAYESGYRLNL